MAGEESIANNAESTPDALHPLMESVRASFREGSAKPFFEWADSQFQSGAFWLDLGMIAGCFGLALLVTWLLQQSYLQKHLNKLRRAGAKIIAGREIKPFLAVFILFLWTALLIANGVGFSAPFLRLVALISTLFFCIRLPSRLVTKGQFWIRLVSTLVFFFAALHITGLLDEVSEFLEARALTLGEVQISILDVMKGLLSIVTLFWLAGILSRVAEKRFHRAEGMAPSVKVLLTKTAKVGFFILAILITIGVMGINITALAVFGGALGLGIGFGLQKVVSNLVSGVILLLDKSIKPGDVIEIGDTYGWINSLNMRHASVVTRDNREHLIPNEDLITNPVINWSYSSELVRIRAPFGISYDSDLRLAMDLACEAANRIERVQSDPAARCLLRGFGDSSVDLELRFWITDPSNGVGRVQSEVLLQLWDLFHEHGIQFPFPQRDIHVKSGLEALDARPAPAKKAAPRKTAAKKKATAKRSEPPKSKDDRS